MTDKPVYLGGLHGRPALSAEEIARQSDDDQALREALLTIADLIESLPLPPKFEIARDIGLGAFRFFIGLFIPDTSEQDLFNRIHEMVERIVRDALEETTDQNYRIQLQTFATWYAANYQLIRSVYPEDRKMLFQTLTDAMPSLIEASIYYKAEVEGEDREARDIRRKRCLHLYLHTQSMRVLGHKELFILGQPDLYDSDKDILVYFSIFKANLLQIIEATVDHWEYMEAYYGHEAIFYTNPEMVKLGETFVRLKEDTENKVLPVAMGNYGKKRETIQKPDYGASTPRPWQLQTDIVSSYSADMFHYEYRGITVRYPGRYYLRSRILETRGDAEIGEPVVCHMCSYDYRLSRNPPGGSLGSTNADIINGRENPGNPQDQFNGLWRRMVLTSQDENAEPHEMECFDGVQMILSTSSMDAAELEVMNFSVESEAGAVERIHKYVAKFRTNALELVAETEHVVIAWEKDNLRSSNPAERNPRVYVNKVIDDGIEQVISQNTNQFEFLVADVKVRNINVTPGDAGDRFEIKCSMDHKPSGGSFVEICSKTYKSSVAAGQIQEIEIPVVGCAVRSITLERDDIIRVRLLSSHAVETDFVNLDLMPSVT